MSLVTLLPWTWTALIVLVGQAASLPLSVRQESSLSQNPNPIPDSTHREPTLLALSWLLVPLLIAWTLARTDIARLFFLRYVMLSAPAAILLAVLAIRMLPSRLIQFAAGAGIALFALCTVAAFQLVTDGRLITKGQGDWRSAIAHFNKQPQRGRFPVLVATQLIESEMLRGSSDPVLANYCLYPVHSLYPIDADPAHTIPLPRTSPGQLQLPVRELVRGRGGAWLIFAGSATAANEATREIAQSVQSPTSKVQSQGQDWLVAERRSFGTIHIVLLRASQQ